MNYKVKCTHCISLLKNIRKFENSKYIIHDGECFIEVNDDIVKMYIDKIEFHMEDAYWYYRNLIEMS